MRSIGLYGSDWWLGSLPPDWAAAPVGANYSVLLGKMLDAGRNEDSPQRPYLANKDVQWGRFDLHELRTMPFAHSEWDRYGVEPGDVMVCEGGEVGRCAVWNGGAEGVHFQKAIHRLRSLGNGEPRYLAYALEAAARNGVFEAGEAKSTIAHLTREKLAEFRVPVPPLEEQRRIADRLDTETARIDTLIAKTTEAATLVEERRSRVATQAIDGVGSRRPLRYCLDRYIGGVWGEEPGADEVNVRVLRAADFDRVRHRLTVTRAPMRSVGSAQHASRRMRPGDIVLEKSGGGDTQPVGCVAVFEGHAEPCVPSNFNALLRPRGDVVPDYLNVALAAAYRSGSSWRYVNQTTGIQNVDVEAFMSQPVPMPALAEQRDIATRVLSAWDVIDATRQALTRQQSLLRERRRALITAAVTGEIEV